MLSVPKAIAPIACVPPAAWTSSSPRSPATARLPRAAHLPFVEETHVLDGYPEALLDLRRERLSRPLNLLRRDPHRLGADATEAFGVLKDGFIAPLAHVLDDPARCVADLLREKAPGTAQFADNLAWVPLPRVQLSNQKAPRSPVSRRPGLRLHGGAGGMRRGWRSDAPSSWRSHRAPRVRYRAASCPSR